MTKAESLEGSYKFVADLSELSWFFDNVLEDLSNSKINHSYLMCIATRPKKLSKEEREEFGLLKNLLGVSINMNVQNVV